MEKRRCHRFEIPGANGRYRKTGLLHFGHTFSRICPLLNLSKGGAAFLCDARLRKGQKLIFQLLVPSEPPLNLRSKVRRQAQATAGNFRVVGVEFLPFADRGKCNPIEALNALKNLAAKYGNAPEEIRDRPGIDREDPAI